MYSSRTNTWVDVSVVVCYQAMRKHSDSIAVQRQACLALRNLVARNAELRPLALEEDIDPLLRTVRMKHPAYGLSPLPCVCAIAHNCVLSVPQMSRRLHSGIWASRTGLEMVATLTRTCCHCSYTLSIVTHLHSHRMICGRVSLPSVICSLSARNARRSVLQKHTYRHSTRETVVLAGILYAPGNRFIQ